MNVYVLNINKQSSWERVKVDIEDEWGEGYIYIFLCINWDVWLWKSQPLRVRKKEERAVHVCCAKQQTVHENGKSDLFMHGVL
jgi:hypothetical protein